MGGRPVERYRGRSYAPEIEVTENVDGEGTPTIRLASQPVTAVLSVVVANWPQTAAPFDASAYAWYADGRVSLKPLPEEFALAQPVWPVGRQNVQVTYRHGRASGAKVPADVQFASAQVTALIAKYAKKGLLGPVAEEWTVGDVKIKVQANAQLSAAIQDILEATLGKPSPGIW